MEEAITATGDSYLVFTDPTRDRRRQQAAASLQQLRTLNASRFTVDELALLLGTSPYYLDDAGLTRIEEMAARHQTDFFDIAGTGGGR